MIINRTGIAPRILQLIHGNRNRCYVFKINFHNKEINIKGSVYPTSKIRHIWVTHFPSSDQLSTIDFAMNEMYLLEACSGSKTEISKLANTISAQMGIPVLNDAG